MPRIFLTGAGDRDADEHKPTISLDEARLRSRPILLVAAQHEDRPHPREQELRALIDALVDLALRGTP